jgi:hypothetical protein
MVYFSLWFQRFQLKVCWLCPLGLGCHSISKKNTWQRKLLTSWQPESQKRGWSPNIMPYLPLVKPHLLKVPHFPVVPEASNQTFNIWGFEGHLKYKL